MQHLLESGVVEPGGRGDGPTTSQTRPRRIVPWQEALRLAVLAAGAFLLGGATSIGQGVLPGALGPLANSASGWTLVTALLVALLTRRGWSSAVGGVVSFALLNLGYTAMSNLSGHPDSFTGFWVIAGFVVGGPIGLAVHWLPSTTRWRTAAGAAALAAIGLGDAGFGLTHPGSSSLIYAAVISAASIALLVVAGRRVRAPLLFLAMVASALLLALVYVAALSALG